MYITDCEADDIIGYLARHTFRDRNVIIVSSDHDYAQLVSDRVRIWSPTLKGMVGIEDVIKRFGVPPRNVCVTRCFAGDTSDSIEGIKGVGVATLVKRFPMLAEDRDVTIEEVLQAADAHPGKNRLKALKEITQNADVVKRNWKLMHLDVSNLSGNQVSKLNSSFEIELPHSNKFELMRLMIRHGVKTFDVDRFILQITANIRN
jgi:5'-3' exonuclease